MKIETDFLTKRYKLKYLVGIQEIVSYIDWTCTREQKEEWITFHKQMCRHLALEYLLLNE